MLMLLWIYSSRKDPKQVKNHMNHSLRQKSLFFFLFFDCRTLDYDVGGPSVFYMPLILFCLLFSECGGVNLLYCCYCCAVSCVDGKHWGRFSARVFWSYQSDKRCVRTKHARPSALTLWQTAFDCLWRRKKEKKWRVWHHGGAERILQNNKSVFNAQNYTANAERETLGLIIGYYPLHRSLCLKESQRMLSFVSFTFIKLSPESALASVSLLSDSEPKRHKWNNSLKSYEALLSLVNPSDTSSAFKHKSCFSSCYSCSVWEKNLPILFQKWLIAY